MQQNYFVTYRFYNRKGQRLSIFATTKEGVISNEHSESLTTCGLSIYIVTCSKLDRFSKKMVRSAFEQGQIQGSFDGTGINPVIVNMPCMVGDSKRVFMDYCNRNFYKLEESTIYGTNIALQFDTLTKRGYDGDIPQGIILPNTVRQVKTLSATILDRRQYEDFMSNDSNVPNFDTNAIGKEIQEFLDREEL